MTDRALQEESSKGPPCGEHDIRLQHLEANNKKQWEVLDKLRNRPPVWVTVVISLLTFLLGCAVTCAGIAVRLATAK